MKCMNKVILLGNLGADPEIKYTPSGKAVAKISVATNEQWKDKNGDKQTRTYWHRIIAWERLAEICGEYLKKGDPVLFEGKMVTREYESEGSKKFITEVIASDLIMLGTKHEEVKGAKAEKGRTRGTTKAAPPVNEMAGSEITDDDIPF